MTIYTVYDYDSVWYTTRDSMDAISVAAKRYRDLNDGTDCGKALADCTRVTETYTNRDGEKVTQDYDWQDAYRQLTGHPAYAR
jgi:hypothetical protein